MYGYNVKLLLIVAKLQPVSSLTKKKRKRKKLLQAGLDNTQAPDHNTKCGQAVGLLELVVRFLAVLVCSFVQCFLEIIAGR